MFQIVSGEVEFTTPRPFETKSACVKLSFTIDPGMNAEEAIALVGAMAKNRAEGMISNKLIGGLVSIAEDVVVPPPIPPTKGRKVVSPAVSSVSTQEPASVTTNVSALPSAGQVPDASPFGATSAPSSDAAPVGPIPSSVSVAGPTPRIPLTDKAMQEACADKVNKADLAGRDALKAKVIALIKSSIPEGGPVTVIAVPAEKRMQFLAELAALA